MKINQKLFSLFKNNRLANFHSSMNPLAQYQNDMTVEDILAARVVSYPLTVPMCAPVGDGSAAAVICSKTFLEKHPNTRAVRIRASVLGSGSSRSKDEDDQDIGMRLSKKAYEIAQAGPADIDLAEVHDATAFGELHQYEALGIFWKKNEKKNVNQTLSQN